MAVDCPLSCAYWSPVCTIPSRVALLRIQAAVNVAGVGASILTCIGEDAHGAELERTYAAEGIDTQLLLHLPDASTSLAVRQSLDT